MDLVVPLNLSLPIKEVLNLYLALFSLCFLMASIANAIIVVGPGYKAPSYNALREKELDEELKVC